MRIDPQFASLAKDLVIMGGYVDLHLLADYKVGCESLSAGLIEFVVILPISMLQYINELHDRS